MNNVVDFEHKWAKEVGRVFIAFGSIESTTLSCLEVIPKENIFEIVKSMSLSRRIDLIVEIIEDHENILSKNLSNNLLYAKELAVQTEALSLALFVSTLEYFKYLDPEFYSSNV